MTRTKIGTIALAATALVAIGCGGGSTGDEKANEPSAIVTDGPAPATSASTSSAPKPAAPVLRPSDIKLTVKELSRSCFGSAGCNVEFRISGVTIPESKIDPEATYEISYAFKGLEDPKTGTFTLQGDGTYEVEATEYGQVTSKSKKVTAVATAVEKM